jgi:hypothetical protein
LDAETVRASEAGVRVALVIVVVVVICEMKSGYVTKKRKDQLVVHDLRNNSRNSGACVFRV